MSVGCGASGTTYDAAVAELTREHLAELSSALAGDALWLDLADAPQARRTRDELRDQIDGYLLPRLARLQAPLLVVIGGSTGSGKSSLTNALVGEAVTMPGVLRPTTRRPVLVCHPHDRVWFANEDSSAGAELPELSRTTGPADDAVADPDGVRLVVTDRWPAGMAILDSPDIDSVESANHDLAALLLGAADLWLFVTTAVRYADAVPWAYLARAAERAVALAVVVNRIPGGATEAIVGDLRRMLNDHGLSSAALFPIGEGDLDVDAAVVRDWLWGIASSDDERRRVVAQTIDGLVASVPGRVDVVAGGVARQAQAAAALARAADAVWAEAAQRVDTGMDDGIALRHEVLARFSEHVGTSEVMGRIQNGIGRVRDRVAATLRGRPAPAAEVKREVGDTVEDLIVRVADRAALGVVERWEALPGGAQVLGRAPSGIDRARPDLRRDAQQLVLRWQDAVLEMVVDQAGSKVTLARSLSLGINGVAAALMIGVFSQTGGLTGGEAAIAGGAAAASQTVLSAVFGDQVVRDLVRAARRDLIERVAALYETERARFDQLLADLPRPNAADELRRLAAEVAR